MRRGAFIYLAVVILAGLGLYWVLQVGSQMSPPHPAAVAGAPERASVMAGITAGLARNASGRCRAFSCNCWSSLGLPAWRGGSPRAAGSRR